MRPSFETPRKRAAPLDDGSVYCTALGCNTGRYPAREDMHVDGGVRSMASRYVALRVAITIPRPQQQPALRNQIAVLICPHHRAVGQYFDRHRKRMQPFCLPVQSFGVQHLIHLRRAHSAEAVPLLPRRAKSVGVVAAAVEARAVSGRERGRLIEKEQFGPAPRGHHVAAAAAEFANASDPRLAAPAPVQQRLRRRIMDDAAIAGEQAALRRRDDLAGRRDTILQRRPQVTPRRRGSAAGRPARYPRERRSRCPATPR